MSRVLTGNDYARKMLIRFGIYISLMIAFPYLASQIIIASGAPRVSGASGVMAITLGITLLPLSYLALAFATLKISAARARTAGFSSMLGLSIPLLILCDFAAGIRLSIALTTGSAMAAFLASPPLILSAACIIAATLCLMNDLDAPTSIVSVTILALWKAMILFFLLIGIVELLPLLWVWTLGAKGYAFLMTSIKFASYIRSNILPDYVSILLLIVLSAVVVATSAAKPPVHRDPFKRPPSTGSRTNMPNSKHPMFGGRKA